MKNWINIVLETGKDIGKLIIGMAGVTVGVGVVVLWIKWTMQLSYWLIER